MLCGTKTYSRQALSTAIASPWSSDRTTKGDKRPGPLRVSDRVMTCHDLLGLQISKLAFIVKKGSQFAAGSTSSRARLFLERWRQCKNTRVRKISKQKHLWEVITIKRKIFRQVKTINPFPLNKMFHIDYKIAEEGLIYNQLQNSRGRHVLHRLQNSLIYN